LSRQVTTETTVLVSAPPAIRAWTELLRGHAATTRALGTGLQAEGLTINDFCALSTLAAADGGRMRRVDLAGRLQLTPSGVTRLLERLEAEGLVKRAECSADLRVTYAQLTDAGREKLRAAGCGHTSSVRALFEERLDDDELETLAGLLERL
jgi:MarR family transcriptional regulator, 2-MHQ and catechol-resistance regulon repressor